MHTNKLVFILLILMSASSYGQKRCNCIDNLVETILKVETNYAGFPAKVTQKNRLEYEKLKQELRLKATVFNDPDL